MQPDPPRVPVPMPAIDPEECGGGDPFPRKVPAPRVPERCPTALRRMAEECWDTAKRFHTYGRHAIACRYERLAAKLSRPDCAGTGRAKEEE